MSKGKGKSSENGNLIVGLIAIVVIIYLSLDIFTICVKYYNINQANDYVSNVILNEDEINPTSEVKIEDLNSRLLKYYDSGFMESHPRLFINDVEVDLRGYDKVEKLEFPKGNYKVVLTGYHQSYLVPMKFGKYTDISSARKIKK